VPLGEPLKILIGPLTIWCMREKNELRISWRSQEEINGSYNTPLPEKMEWKRWVFKQRNPRIAIKPVFPDRPVLI
jgi:hypothetical protein